MTLTDPVTLARLVEMARAHRMTDEERERQRRSFVFGNVSIENPLVTREMVDEVADAMCEEPSQ